MKKISKENLLLLVKSVFYRLWGTITTIIISFLFTGDFKISLGIGAVEAVSKIILYYVYEKIWIYIIKFLKLKKDIK